MEERTTTFQNSVNRKLQATFENTDFTFYTFPSNNKYPFEIIKIVRSTLDEITSSEEDDVLKKQIEDSNLSTWKLHVSINVEQLRDEMSGLNTKCVPFEVFLSSIRDDFRGQLFYFKIANLDIFERNRNGAPSVKKGRLYYGAQITIYMGVEDTGYDHANFVPCLQKTFKEHAIKPGLLPRSDRFFNSYISCRKQFNNNGEYVAAKDQVSDETKDSDVLRAFELLDKQGQRKKSRLEEERRQVMVEGQELCVQYNDTYHVIQFAEHHDNIKQMANELAEMIKLDALAIKEREKLVKQFTKKYAHLSLSIIRQAFKKVSREFNQQSKSTDDDTVNEVLFKIFQTRDEIFKARYAYLNKKATQKALVFAVKRSPLLLLVLPTIPIIVTAYQKHKEFKNNNDIRQVVLEFDEYQKIQDLKLKAKHPTLTEEKATTLQLFNSRGNFKMGLWQPNAGQSYYLPIRNAVDIDKKLKR